MSSKKIISINPDFFTVSSRKTKTKENKHNKTQRKRNTKQRIQKMSLKPNKIKKDLLKRIKEYQNKNKQNGGTTNDNGQGTTNNSSEKQSELSFDDALSSLEKIIKDKKKVKQKKQKQQLQKSEKKLTIQTPTSLSGGSTSQPSNVVQSQQPGSAVHNRHHHNPLIKPDPPFGCLKGGKKKTYRQYFKMKHNKTLRKPEQNSVKKHTLHIGGHVSKDSGNNKNLGKQDVTTTVTTPSIDIRKQKMDEFKRKYVLKQNIHNKKYKKKYKVHTYRKTYKLGKKGGKVNVLIKNNKTRKKVKKAVDALDKTPFIEVKRYLKQRHMIKTGTPAPEYVLREMYKNAMLAGDIHNKNDEVLVHNYFNE